MPKETFLSRYRWALIYAAATVASLPPSLSSQSSILKFLGFASVLVFGAGTVWQCAIAAMMAHPTRFQFQHSDWTFHPDDPKAIHRMPFIRLPRSTHKRGTHPRVEFQQVDPIYGPPYYPVETDDDGNITITKDYGAFGMQIPPFAVLIHYR